MDIRYVDHDPLSRLKPIDNTLDMVEDERITKKDTRGREVQTLASTSEAGEVPRRSHVDHSMNQSIRVVASCTADQ
jgi:hypothetical protein